MNVRNKYTIIANVQCMKNYLRKIYLIIFKERLDVEKDHWLIIDLSFIDQRLRSLIIWKQTQLTNSYSPYNFILRNQRLSSSQLFLNQKYILNSNYFYSGYATKGWRVDQVTGDEEGQAEGDGEHFGEEVERRRKSRKTSQQQRKESHLHRKAENWTTCLWKESQEALSDRLTGF